MKGWFCEMALYRSLGIDKQSKIIEIPLFQAVQTRRSDADDSKAIITLYSKSGFLDITSNIIIKSSVLTFNGAEVCISVGDSSDECNTVVFDEIYHAYVDKKITCNLLNKKFVKIVLFYRNQSGDYSDQYGAFLKNTIIHKQ